MAEDTTFDWSKPVDEWDNEQLNAWTHNNIKKNTLPDLDWHERQVEVWARKVCLFTEADAAVLIEKRVNGRALITYKDYKEVQVSLGLPEGTARSLWLDINKMRKAHNISADTQVSPALHADIMHLKEFFKVTLENAMNNMQIQSKKNSKSPLFIASSYSREYHDSQPYITTNSGAVLQSLNKIVPAVPKPFSINSLKSEDENAFVLQLAKKIKANIDSKQQKLYLHVTQNKKFRGFNQKPDMVLTTRATAPASPAEIVVWIELKTHNSEYEARGQLVSGLTTLSLEAQCSRDEFYGAVINTHHVKLMKYTGPGTEDPAITWTEDKRWGLPSVDQDDAIKTILQLINTPAESLGYHQTSYPSEITVSKIHSPVFSQSLTLYDLHILRNAVKRPNIVRVCIERSDLHKSTATKRPNLGDSEYLEGVMKLGNATCKNEILREREALERLNPKTTNSATYTTDRRKIPFIPELLGYDTLNNNDDHVYNVIAPFGTQLDKISTLDQFNRVLEDINRALIEAHKQSIFHADVSAKNIILTKDNAVLIDWGFAIIADTEKNHRGFTGTPLFASIKTTKLLYTSERADFTARDDFESLFYVLLYCISGKKLPWSNSTDTKELFNGKKLAMTSDWKTTLDSTPKDFHEKLKQMHHILFPENLYHEHLEVHTLIPEPTPEN